MVHERRNQEEEAEAAYRKALALNPDLSEVHLNLGRLLQKQQQRNEAIGHYKDAIRINPDALLAYHNLGIAYKDQGLDSLAIETFEAGLVRQPDNAQWHNNLGVLYQKNTRFDEALGAYHKSIEADSTLLKPILISRCCMITRAAIHRRSSDTSRS